jgi:N-acylneuraminate cytidylyltransferase
MLAHTLDAALTSRSFERVLVSTEDEEIADVAQVARSEVLKRPAELATDAVRVTDVCLDVLEKEESAGRIYEAFAFLQATAPLRRAEDIAAVLALLLRLRVGTYTLPPHQALRIAGDGTLTPMWPELIEHRRARSGRWSWRNASPTLIGVAAFRQQKIFLRLRLARSLMPRER